MTNKLVVENLSFSYGKNTILHDVSFTCTDGIVALLGNNGARKTTLLNILTGLKKGETGKISLNDIDLVHAKEYPIHLVGYLPQQFDIYDDITGYDFLSHVYDTKGLDHHTKKTEIDEVIEKFNLATVIHKKFKSYSGGYKRRLGIAQAVLGKPSLIIIDEPTVGLDPEQRAEFRNYLFEISHHAITLISTHIIEDVELFSHKILILKDRHIGYDGSIDDIISESKKHIHSMEVTLDQFVQLKQQFTIIEQKRIRSDKIRIRYIQKDGEHPVNHPEKEISLENAYIYFQKK